MKEKPTETVRLDKWLWAARFYKTRALAREMIEGGKVHYNGQRSKPGKIVELDAMLTGEVVSFDAGDGHRLAWGGREGGAAERGMRVSFVSFNIEVAFATAACRTHNLLQF